MLTRRDDDAERVIDRSGEPVRVSRRWTVAAAAVAALTVGAVSFAASQAPPGEARLLGEIFFNNKMARAEVVMVSRGAVHDFRIDQGRVVAVRQGTLELAEADGTRQTIPVSVAAQVVLNGKPIALAAVPRGVIAITIRDGEQPADTVRLTGRGSGKKP